MPLISVITTTSRPNPRLAEMARTLACSLRRGAPDITLEWQVIDQTLGGPDAANAQLERWHAIAKPLAAMMDVIDDKGELKRAGRARLSHRAIPNASGLTPAKLRNEALALATGEYVVFLDDCTIVTPGFLTCAAACAAEGLGWRVKAHSIQDVSVPADGVVRYRDHWDRLRSVPPATVGGPCWGVPRAALVEIGGFDLAYDGELKHNELETITRLARIGVSFVSTERAIAVRLRRTQTQISGPEAYVGKRNTALYNELVVDKHRVSHHDARGQYVARKARAGGADPFGEDDETPIADLPHDGPPSGRPPGVPLPGLPPAPGGADPVAAPAAPAPFAAAPRPKPARQRQRQLPAAMMSKSMVQKRPGPNSPARKFATASPAAAVDDDLGPVDPDDDLGGGDGDDEFDALEGETGEAVNTDAIDTLDETPETPTPPGANGTPVATPSEIAP